MGVYDSTVFSVFLMLTVFTEKTNTVGISPRNMSLSVTKQFLQYPDIFLNWDYGGALSMDGMYQADKEFGFNLTKVMDNYLDNFLEDKNALGYKLLHNQHIDWGRAVGDNVGLFPIAYLNRMQSQSTQRGYNKSRDTYVVRKVAEEYILKWPYRLPDGTFSRLSGWQGEAERNASFLWQDDQYMGLTLLARLSVYLRKPSYAEFAAKQALSFRKAFEDPEDHLYQHGFNYADDHQSCCKWGRGNGWGMLSHIEILKALVKFPQLKNSSLYDHMVYLLQMHALAVMRTQAENGGWHQILNETSTFLETSCTAMFLQSFVQGVQHGWMIESTFSHAIQKAWESLQSSVQPDGQVNGVCCGTGIGASIREYQERPTLFLLSSHGGVGVIVSAAVAYEQYTKHGSLMLRDDLRT